MDGETLLAIGDNGNWFRLALAHTPDGRLHSVRLAAAGRLAGVNGRPFASKAAGDAESAARLPDGRLAVGFEGHSRILVYPPDLTGRPERWDAPPAFGKTNRGLEALTVADGALVGLGEQGGQLWHHALPFAGPDWQAMPYGRHGGFRPTGAATLPDHSILVLERLFAFPGRLAARLVHLPRLAGPATATPAARATAREIARLRAPFPIDNMEAIAVRETPAGRLFVYLLSDNNFSFFQRNLLLQFEWRGQSRRPAGTCRPGPRNSPPCDKM